MSLDKDGGNHITRISIQMLEHRLNLTSNSVWSIMIDTIGHRCKRIKGATASIVRAAVVECLHLHFVDQEAETMLSVIVRLSPTSVMRRIVNVCSVNIRPTPSNSRTQLGSVAQPASRLGAGDSRNQTSTMNRSPPKGHASAQRQAFGNLGTNGVSRPNAGGYGLSAGMKSSQQQGGERLSRFRSFLTSSNLSMAIIDVSRFTRGWRV